MQQLEEVFNLISKEQIFGVSIGFCIFLLYLIKIHMSRNEVQNLKMSSHHSVADLELKLQNCVKDSTELRNRGNHFQSRFLANRDLVLKLSDSNSQLLDLLQECEWEMSSKCGDRHEELIQKIRTAIEKFTGSNNDLTRSRSIDPIGDYVHPNFSRRRRVTHTLVNKRMQLAGLSKKPATEPALDISSLVSDNNENNDSDGSQDNEIEVMKYFFSPSGMYENSLSDPPVTPLYSYAQSLIEAKFNESLPLWLLRHWLDGNRLETSYGFVPKDFRPFVMALCNQDFEILRSAYKLCDYSETVVVTKDIFPVLSPSPLFLNLIKILFKEDIEVCENAGTIFRANTFGTKIATEAFDTFGDSYLSIIFDNLFDNIEKLPVLEINPNQCSDEESMSLETKYSTLLDLSQTLLNNIFQSIVHMPLEFRNICKEAYLACQNKYPESALIAVSSLLFLRFICPALVAPGSVPIEKQRTIVLIAKVLQNLANGVLFGTKEEYMRGCNSFITKNRQPMNDFLLQVCNLERDNWERKSITSSIRNSQIVSLNDLIELLMKKSFRERLFETLKEKELIEEEFETNYIEEVDYLTEQFQEISEDDLPQNTDLVQDSSEVFPCYHCEPLIYLMKEIPGLPGDLFGFSELFLAENVSVSVIGDLLTEEINHAEKQEKLFRAVKSRGSSFFDLFCRRIAGQFVRDVLFPFRQAISSWHFAEDAQNIAFPLFSAILSPTSVAQLPISMKYLLQTVFSIANEKFLGLGALLSARLLLMCCLCTSFSQECYKLNYDLQSSVVRKRLIELSSYLLHFVSSPLAENVSNLCDEGIRTQILEVFSECLMRNKIPLSEAESSYSYKPENFGKTLKRITNTLSNNESTLLYLKSNPKFCFKKKTKYSLGAQLLGVTSSEYGRSRFFGEFL